MKGFPHFRVHKYEEIINAEWICGIKRKRKTIKMHMKERRKTIKMHRSVLEDETKFGTAKNMMKMMQRRDDMNLYQQRVKMKDVQINSALT